MGQVVRVAEVLERVKELEERIRSMEDDLYAFIERVADKLGDIGE